MPRPRVKRLYHRSISPPAHPIHKPPPPPDRRARHGLLAAAVRHRGRAEQHLDLSPVSPPADTIRELFFLVVAVCAGILLVVEGVLIYLLLRFRRRPTDLTTEPPQVYGSTPIEIAWTTAPALIVSSSCWCCSAPSSRSASIRRGTSPAASRRASPR
ncbi:MAG: cytochrome c oxidase subunit II transmembrane domain-containing protein [Gemmataceae bacterium]